MTQTSHRPQYASRISGTGSGFPKKVVTNEDLRIKLAALGLETNDAWIQERTGIKARRYVTPGDPEDFNSSLCAKASLQALEMAGKTPDDVDMIVVATTTPDRILPSTACYVQGKIGAKRAWAVDLNAACSGYIYALAMADQFIQSGNARTALVIGSDLLSTITNFNDRGSCIIFGDGAGATVVERTDPDNPRRVRSFHLRSDGALTDMLYIPAGGSAELATPETCSQEKNKVRMNGREVYKHAVRTMYELAIEALETNGLTAERLDWFLPHQANLRIVEAIAERMNFPMSRVLLNIGEFANTSAATIPTLLDQAVRAGQIKPGHSLLFDAFGAGVTSGSALVHW